MAAGLLALFTVPSGLRAKPSTKPLLSGSARLGNVAVIKPGAELASGIHTMFDPIPFAITWMATSSVTPGIARPVRIGAGTTIITCPELVC